MKKLRAAQIPALLFAATLASAGCWAPPVANVQPKGPPRLIQDSIAVESLKEPAIVRSVDQSNRTIAVQAVDAGTTTTYKIGPQVEHFDRVKVGDKVQPAVTEELTIYALRDGQLPDAHGAAQTIAADAKVLKVDRSYRLLTVRYPNGRDETFKVGLEVRLDEMEAGDSVVIRPIEAVSLRVHWL
jgi:hypothetical protein